MAGLTVPTFTDAMSQVKPGSDLPTQRFNPSAPDNAFGGSAQEKFGQSVVGAEGAVADYFKEQKDRADKLKHIEADTKASETQTTIQQSIAKMKGKDALDAPDYAQARWDTDMQKIEDGLVGQNQKLAFAATRAQRWQDLNRSVQMHVTGEIENFADQTYQSGMEQARNAAVLNAGDDHQVGQNLDVQKQLMEGWAERKGVPLDSDIYKNKFTAEQSATHLGVVNARLESGLDDGAQKYFDEHKSEMSAADILHAESRLDASKVVGESSSIFDKVLGAKGFKFSDGTVNAEKVRQLVMQETKDAGMSDQRGVKVLGQVKAMVAEYNRDRYHAIASNERTFANNVITARKDGATLQDSLKLATKYGTDAYDIATKQAFIEKTYEPPAETKAIAHEQLKEGIQDGVVDKPQLDHALEKRDISPDQYANLLQLHYKTKTDGTDPQSKYYDQLIKTKAQQSIGSDKDAVADFMFVLGQKSQGKSPEEKWAIAQDELKKVDNPNGWFPWSTTSKYKIDYDQVSQKDTAQGAMYQDVGYKQVQAISGGMTGDEFHRNASPEANIQSFAQDLGVRYEDLKIGSPINEAVQSLQRNGKQITPAAVRRVLEKYPDGKWHK